MADAFCGVASGDGQGLQSLFWSNRALRRPPTPTDTVPVTACIGVLAGVNGRAKQHRRRAVRCQPG